MFLQRRNHLNCSCWKKQKESKLSFFSKKNNLYEFLFINLCVFRFIVLYYWYGKLRRTDFLPIGPDRDDEVFERGSESADSDSEEDCEMAYACGMNKAFMPLSDGEQSESERQHCMGNDLDDFLPYEESVGEES